MTQIIQNPAAQYWLRRARGIQGAGADVANVTPGGGFGPVATCHDGATLWILQQHSYANATGDAPAHLTQTENLSAVTPTVTAVSLPAAALHAHNVQVQTGSLILSGAKKPASDWQAAVWARTNPAGSWSEVAALTSSGHHLNCGAAWKTTYIGAAYLFAVADAGSNTVYLATDTGGKVAASEVPDVAGGTLAVCRSTGLPLVEAYRVDADTYYIGALYVTGSAYVWKVGIWGESSGWQGAHSNTFTIDLGPASDLMSHRPWFADLHDTVTFWATAWSDPCQNMLFSLSGGDYHAQEIEDNIAGGLEFDFGGPTDVSAIASAAGWMTSDKPYDTEFAADENASEAAFPPHVHGQSIRRVFVLPTGRIGVYAPIENFRSADSSGDVDGALWELVICAGTVEEWSPDRMAISRPDTRDAITDPYQFPSDLATLTASSEIAGMEAEFLQQDSDCALGYTWGCEEADHFAWHFDFGAGGYEANHLHICGSRSRGITPSLQQFEARENGTALVDLTGTHTDIVVDGGAVAVSTDGSASYGIALIDTGEVGGVIYYPSDITTVSGIANLYADPIPLGWFVFASTVASFTDTPGPVLVSAGGVFSWDNAPLDDTTGSAITKSGEPTFTESSPGSYAISVESFTIDGFTFDSNGGSTGCVVISRNFQPDYDYDLESPALRLYAGNAWPPTTFVAKVHWYRATGDRGALFDLNGTSYRYYTIVGDVDLSTFTDTEPFECARAWLGAAIELDWNYVRGDEPLPTTGVALEDLGGATVIARDGESRLVHTMRFENVPPTDSSAHQWLRLGIGMRTPALAHFDIGKRFWICPAGKATNERRELGLGAPRYGLISAIQPVQAKDAAGVRYHFAITHVGL